jgi:C-terminal processing protease CtpA/Prc
MKTRFYFTTCIVYLLTACDGDSGFFGSNNNNFGQVAEPTSCDFDSQQQFIYDVMTDTYLWYDEVPSVSLSNFSTLEATLDALKAPKDRFSYIASSDSHSNFFNDGTYEGYGIKLVANEAANAYEVAFVYEDSPAGSAGINRTDKITAFNGSTASELIDNAGLGPLLDDLALGDPLVLNITHNNDTRTEQTLRKALVTMNTILTAERIETEAQQSIGYIGISSFIDATSNDFSNAINEITASPIDELVLDLRYNGGGRLLSSRDVASYIGGEQTEDFNYSKTIHNDKYSDSNLSYPFKTFSNALGLSRVYVLTSAATCSASELLINSLSPFIDVVKIGTTSCGKPVGMYGAEFCNNIILPLQFSIANHYNEGDYFEGLVPDCLAEDDLGANFADTNEKMLSTAIYHMNNNVCPIATVSDSSSARRTQQSLIKKAAIDLNPLRHAY